MPTTCGLSRPQAMPCNSRAETSRVAVGATPHSALVAVNRPTPSRNMRVRPCWSPSLPEGTSTRPKVSA